MPDLRNCRRLSLLSPAGAAYPRLRLQRSWCRGHITEYAPGIKKACVQLSRISGAAAGFPYSPPLARPTRGSGCSAAGAEGIEIERRSAESLRAAVPDLRGCRRLSFLSAPDPSAAACPIRTPEQTIKVCYHNTRKKFYFTLDFSPPAVYYV